MTIIASWIQTAIDEHSLTVRELAPEATEKLLLDIRQKFVEPDFERPMWETLRSRASKRRAAGWQDIGLFVGENSCVILIEDERNAYECTSGKVLTKLLEECPGFEFYVTNDKGDYLLCHNHHNYLLGCGSAVDWVQSLNDDF
jgi:hypothetical protein